MSSNRIFGSDYHPYEPAMTPQAQLEHARRASGAAPLHPDVKLMSYDEVVAKLTEEEIRAVVARAGPKEGILDMLFRVALSDRIISQMKASSSKNGAGKTTTNQPAGPSRPVFGQPGMSSTLIGGRSASEGAINGPFSGNARMSHAQFPRQPGAFANPAPHKDTNRGLTINVAKGQGMFRSTMDLDSPLSPAGLPEDRR